MKGPLQRGIDIFVLTEIRLQALDVPSSAPRREQSSAKRQWNGKHGRLRKKGNSKKRPGCWML